MTEVQHHVISVVIDADGGRVHLPYQTIQLPAAPVNEMVSAAVQVLLQHVRAEGRPIDVTVNEPGSVQHLRVSPSGNIDIVETTHVDQANSGPGSDAEPNGGQVPASGPVDRPAPVHQAPPTPVRAAPTQEPDDPPSLDTAEFEAVLNDGALPGAPVDREPAPAPAPVPEPMHGDEAPDPDITRVRPASPVEEAAAATPAAIAPTTSPVMAARDRRSFIEQKQVERPARTGVRGMLGRVGIRIEPSAAELAEREDRRAVSQHWPGKRTIAIVNGKGGAGKTPTTVCLSAIFAHNGGAGVVAWDNNQNRGTLGWRTEQGPHDATLLELRDRAKELLHPRAEAADIARFVHHQPEDKFDVLRSQPMMLRDEQRLGVNDFKSIHRVLGKYYRLIFVDSGNDESDPLWGRMIDHADQIVVATSTRGDIAEAGALLLEALSQRDEHSAALARNAVVVVSQANQHAPASETREIALEFSHIARDTVAIPYDRGMVEGPLQLSSLRPATRRAWLAAGAAVARGL